MRDVKRIEDVLNRLKTVWERYPDMRLGQLISNVVSDLTLYYIEDKDLIDVIELFYTADR